jgi:hypothetical protein
MDKEIRDKIVPRIDRAASKNSLQGHVRGPLCASFNAASRKRGSGQRSTVYIGAIGIL